MKLDVTLEKTIEELDAKSEGLRWRRKTAKYPRVTSNDGDVKLNQFTTVDNDRQIFIYETIVHCPETVFDPGCGYFGDSLEIQVPARSDRIFGIAIFRARKSMADYFAPSGVVVWKGTYAKPTDEGLVLHQEHKSPSSRIKRIYDRIKAATLRNQT